MEVGELVDVEIPVQDDDPDCPFTHQKPNPTEKNELGGVGTTLGDNMEGGTGVHKSKPPEGGDFLAGQPDKDPRNRPEPIRSVFITVNDQVVALKGTPLPYPLTCAGHHLIPAQESLKGHDILEFMCKDGEAQEFKNGKDTVSQSVESKVWGNVAYNVNGCHNGVWLPGNYAVGAGVSGVEVWKSRAQARTTYSDDEAAQNWVKKLDLGSDEWKPYSADPVENEGPQDLGTALAEADVTEFMLAGTNYHIDKGNPKWAYVKAAMDRIGAQFHDRHGPYSIEVKKYLTKIAESYERMHARSMTGCQKCKDAVRPDGVSAETVGPPYGIVARLVVGSNFFRGFVGVQVLTARNIYTSQWVSAFMQNPR